MMHLKTWHYVGYLLGLFFTLEPSYIHPDEHFQSIGVIWPAIMGSTRALPWEFDPMNAARSYAPLYLTYGPILYLNKYFLHVESTVTILYLMRLQNYLIFIFVSKLSLQFLLKSKIDRAKADFFISTSYIFWCYQSHTFSNSIETITLLIVLSLFNVLIQDSRDKGCNHYKTSVVLGFAIAFGIFNRVTFPAFILLPFIPTFHKFYLHHIKSFLICCGVFFLTCMAFIAFDTKKYNSDTWCIAPLNNLLYNLDDVNLAEHGLHPRYRHALVNLPQMLGPLLFFFLARRQKLTIPLLSCVSGLGILSLFKHQELRFLIPLMPLFCMSIQLSNFDKYINSNHVIRFWIAFNLIMGVIIGSLHQRGVIMAVDYLNNADIPMGVHLWWKTYSPPTWMYVNDNLTTSTTNFVDNEERLDSVDFSISKNHAVDLKGCSDELLESAINGFFDSGAKHILLVAPRSVVSRLRLLNEHSTEFQLLEIWNTSYNLDFDHYDLNDLTTLQPGMDAYKVSKIIHQVHS